MHQAVFMHCDFHGANFLYTTLSEARMYEVNFKRAILKGIDIEDIEMEQVNLIGAIGLDPEQLESAKKIGKVLGLPRPASNN